MDEYSLFTDETGISDMQNLRQNEYVLCGCLVPNDVRGEIRIRANQIKFKYWGRTDVVFHSNEIGRDEGEFEIFKQNPQLKKEFYRDLYIFLNWLPVIVIAAVSDKKNLLEKNWDEPKLLKENANFLMRNLLNILLTKSSARGEVIIESANAIKNKYYLDAFFDYTSPGFCDVDAPLETRQKLLTAISFVTKHNHDIEEQIADIFAYAAKIKYLKGHSSDSQLKNDYQTKIAMIFQNKLFKVPGRAKIDKLKNLKKVQSYLIFHLEEH
jgi:hypothetical protein